MVPDPSAIEAAFADSSLPATIVGDDDPHASARALARWCDERLGASARACFHCAVSVGVSFGVELADGRRVAVKAQPPTLREPQLVAVHAAQRRLADAAYPCPRPVAGPAPFLGTLAVAEEWVPGDAGDFARPEVVAASAAALADQVRLLRPLARTAPLPPTIAAEPWPPRPHNALFDFSRDAAGAAWIDAVAAAARERLAAGDVVVAHSDWSAKHVRFAGTRVCATYDWDSLRREREPVLAGFAAGCHHVLLDSAAPWRAEPERVRRFLDAYERARSSPFQPEERAAAEAAAVYLFAYTARCEHGFTGRLDAPVTEIRATLEDAAVDLLPHSRPA